MAKVGPLGHDLGLYPESTISRLVGPFCRGYPLPIMDLSPFRASWLRPQDRHSDTLLPDLDDHCGLITCFEVLEHVDPNQLDQCIASLFTYYDSGGDVLISVPHYQWDGHHKTVEGYDWWSERIPHLMSVSLLNSTLFALSWMPPIHTADTLPGLRFAGGECFAVSSTPAATVDWCNQHLPRIGPNRWVVVGDS